MDRRRYQDLLDEMVAWASVHPDVLGLVAVGSTAGLDRSPDEWSDHDLLVVAAPGHSEDLLADPTWVPDHERIVLWHAESDNGRAVVFDDGHLVELAVLDADEVHRVPLSTCRVLVDRGGVTSLIDRIRLDTLEALARPVHDAAWHLRQALEQVLVGLLRAGRGERLSANERIRGRAVTELLTAMAHLVVTVDDIDGDGAARRLDGLDPHRRVELVHPIAATRLDLAMEAPTTVAADTVLALIEETARALAVDLDAALAAVRGVLARVREQT